MHLNDERLVTAIRIYTPGGFTKMRRFISAAMISTALLIPTLGAQTETTAQPKKGEIQRRKQRQQKRIAQGVNNGSLTPKETANLERKEAAINKEVREERKENGGKLTPAEKAQVNRQQNRVSKQIYQDKHNEKQ
jgi:DNA-directed RNA polymerase beta' subunit